MKGISSVSFMVHCDMSTLSHTPPSRHFLVALRPDQNDSLIPEHCILTVSLTSVVDHTNPCDNDGPRQTKDENIASL